MHIWKFLFEFMMKLLTGPVFSVYMVSKLCFKGIPTVTEDWPHKYRGNSLCNRSGVGGLLSQPR